jgi:hypothetical protein
MALDLKTPFPDMFDKLCESKLFQGDIIKRVEDECDLFDGQDDAIGYLIVSNSCDIINDNIEFISLVPIYPFFKAISEYISASKSKFRALASGCEKYKRDGKIREFENQISNIIHEEAKYNRKSTFFLSPLDEFNGLPSLAIIEDIRSIPISEAKDIILSYRICSLKNPWREKLGFKVANLYNRVATQEPAKEAIIAWWKKAYERDYQSVIDILPK